MSAPAASPSPDRPGARAWVPAGADLAALRAAAAGCRGCELYGPATQVVFSAGSDEARVALVGEQPGDQEDRQGLPFVGPAGRLLRRAIDDAGLDASETYRTNAVKHFRFTPTPKRRLHQTPEVAHVEACRPWLEAELAVLDPEVVVALGATAARALLGPSARVLRDRGLLQRRDRTDDKPPGWTMVTVHPSAVLRADDRESAYESLVADLRVVAGALR